MRARLRVCGFVAVVAFFFACGGGDSPPPSTPAPPTPPVSGPASVRGTLTATVEGTPLAGITLTAGGLTTRTASDGSFALDLPAGEHRLTISGTGIVERTTTIRAPASALRIDAIAASGDWMLDFYRELARNGAGGGNLEPLTRWESEPRFFIDTRNEPTTGTPIPEEIVDFVREGIAVTVSLLTDGRFHGRDVVATENPPPDMTPGTVVLRWNAAEVADRAPTANAFAFRVGGPANVVVFRHLEETFAVHHEIGHVLGLYHPLGGHRPSHMWYSGTLAPPHFTQWDIFHARVLYARPSGNSDVDVDPPGFVLGGAAQSVERGGVVASEPIICFPEDVLHRH